MCLWLLENYMPELDLASPYVFSTVWYIALATILFLAQTELCVGPKSHFLPAVMSFTNYLVIVHIRVKITHQLSLGHTAVEKFSSLGFFLLLVTMYYLYAAE